MSDIDEILAEAERWPLDVRKLQKGQDILVHEVERIVGFDSDDARYQFAVLKLREFIIKESQNAGSPLSCCIRGAALHIHTSEEAAVYHTSAMKHGAEKIARNLTLKARTVDASELSDESRAAHDYDLARWGVKLAALRAADKKMPESRTLGGKTPPALPGNGE